MCYGACPENQILPRGKRKISPTEKLEKEDKKKCAFDNSLQVVLAEHIGCTALL